MKLHQEWSLVRHELLLLARTPATGPMCILLVLALGLAAWNGDAWVRSLDKAQNHMTEEQEQRWRTHKDDARRFVQGKLNPAFSDPLDPYTLYAWTPWSSRLESRELAFLAVGQSDLHLSYRVESPAQGSVLQHTAEIQNPSTLVLGRFDLSRCITLVLPLLLMVLILPSSEETNGALGRLLEVQSGSVRLAFLRRTVVRWAAFSMLGGATVLLLTVFFAPTVFTTEPHLFAIATAVILAYCSFWAAIGLACRLFRWSGARSALVYVLVWYGACFLAPAVIDSIASSSSPVFSSTLALLEQRTEDRRIADEPNLAQKLAEELGVKTPLSSQTNIAARVESMRRVRVAREEAQDLSLATRDLAAYRMARLVPPLLAQRLLQRVAGTDTQSLLAYGAFHRSEGQRRVEVTLPALFNGQAPGVLDLFGPVATFSASQAQTAGWAGRAWAEVFWLVLPGLVTALWSAFDARSPLRPGQSQ